MVFNNNLLLGAAGQSGAFDTTLIERSAWLDGAADYMARQNGSAFTNTKEAIFSFWIKRCKFSTQQAFFASVEGGNGFILQFTSADKLEVYAAGATKKVSTQVLRDIAYYHIIVSFDTSQATATDRIKVWVNGEQITSWTTDTAMTLNGDISGLVGAQTGSETMHIGNYNNTVSNYYFWNGYVAQACMLESVSIQQGDYAVSDFLDTYTFGANGSQYVPRADATIAALATAAGGNSFCLTTAIGDGTDASDNSNNFTPTSMSDAANGTANTPSNSIAIWNTLNIGNGGSFVVSEGGQTTSNSSASQHGMVYASQAFTYKTYIEYEITDTTNPTVGISDYSLGNPTAESVGNNTYSWSYFIGGNFIFHSGSSGGGIGLTVSNGDIFMMAFDPETYQLWFGVNGTWVGDPSAGTGATYTVDASNSYVAAVSALDGGSVTTLFDPELWSYTAPTDFKGLSQQDKPTPDYQGIDYFNPILYTGNGSTNAITGVGFQPDLVWIKNTSSATSHSLYDAVRGVQKQLESDNTSAETTETTGLTAFGSDGFTVGSLAQVNGNTNKLMGWSWLAGGAGASNTDGSITSTVSKAAADHFSVVTYTGTGAAATVGHGLGGVPDLIMVKNRGTTGNWATQSSETSYSTNVFYLDLSNNFATAGVNVWNNTDPTSSVFSVRLAADTNASTNTYVAYCFKNVPGVCKIGSYKGNGSSNGPYIPLGFTPSWLMVKSIQGTYGTEWFMYDLTRRNSLQTYAGGNANYDLLYANFPSAGSRYASTAGVDFIADGFKIRGTSTDLNYSGTKFLYIAIADIAGNGDLPPIYGR